MFTINPGEFRHPIQVVGVTNGIDDDGIPTNIETVLLSTRAKILNLSGKDIILADGTSSNISKRFYIRYKNIDLTSKDRIIYDNKTYNITSISDMEEKHKYFEIVAEVIE